MKPDDFPTVRVIDDPEQRGFDPMHPRWKDYSAVTPTFTLVTPGRRALGEDWSKVTIGHDQDSVTVEVEATEAPATGRPIVVAHEGELEQIEYILAATRAKAEERAKEPGQMTPAEKFAAVNEAWHAYMEQKLRWFKGQSTVGSRLYQRQKVERPSNGVER